VSAIGFPPVAVTATALPEPALLRPEKTTVLELTTWPGKGALAVSVESACESRAVGSRRSEPQPPSRSARARMVPATENSFSIPSSYARRADCNLLKGGAWTHPANILPWWDMYAQEGRMSDLNSPVLTSSC